MSGKSDTLKGRLKEATGVLVDNPAIRHEGQVDQEIGRIKKAADKAATETTEKASKIAKKVAVGVKKEVEKLADSDRKMK